MCNQDIKWEKPKDVGPTFLKATFFLLGGPSGSWIKIEILRDSIHVVVIKWQESDKKIKFFHNFAHPM